MAVVDDAGAVAAAAADAAGGAVCGNGAAGNSAAGWEGGSFVVEKTSEGVTFDEQQLPIDILYSKLADWLVDRKKVAADWRKRLAALQARVNRLLPSLPRGAHSKLLSLPNQSEGYSVSYLEARDVRDALAQARPEDRRTLFGGFSGVTGEWDAVVRGYEKEQTLLGEAALILVHNTNYEIPFLRKQAAKLQQQLSDTDRKEADLRRAAAASTAAFESACRELGIEGKHMRSELASLAARELPTIFSSVVETLCQSADVSTAVDYYRDFVAHLQSTGNSGNEEKGEDGGDGGDQRTLLLLPTLSALRADPSSILLPPSSRASEDKQPREAQEHAPLEIKWDLGDGGEGVGENGAAAPVEIDWGITESAREDRGGSVTIDWDVGVVSLKEEARESEGGTGKEESSGEREAAAINWDFSVECEDVDETSDKDKERGGSHANTAVRDASRSVDGDGDAAIVASASEGGIDFSGIDWGISIDESGSEATTSATGADAGAPAASAPMINWDIGFESGGEAGGDREAAGVKDNATREGGKNAGEDELVRNQLVQAGYRNLLLDDLYELHAFLRQRVAEMRREEGSPLQAQLLAQAPAGLIQELTADAISALDRTIANVLHWLTCRRTADLLLIHSSQRHVQRLVEGLEQKKGAEGRMQSSVSELNRKRSQLKSELSATWLRLEEVVRRTKAVKALVEATLSAAYSSRPVNIIGEINNQLG